MANRTSKTDMPLIKRPIDEIVQLARAAGRTAFANADAVEGAAQDIRFEWVGRNFPSGMGMPEDQFNDVITRACAAFDKGLDEYHGTLCRPPASRLPGLAYFFSEDSSCEYGVQIDLSRSNVSEWDAQALYERLHRRLLLEFDIFTSRIAEDTSSADALTAGGPAISTSMLIDDVFLFTIVPVALDRARLIELLPGELLKFVQTITGSEVGHHE